MKEITLSIGIFLFIYYSENPWGTTLYCLGFLGVLYVVVRVTSAIQLHTLAAEKEKAKILAKRTVVLEKEQKAVTQDADGRVVASISNPLPVAAEATPLPPATSEFVEPERATVFGNGRGGYSITQGADSYVVPIEAWDALPWPQRDGIMSGDMRVADVLSLPPSSDAETRGSRTAEPLVSAGFHRVSARVPQGSAANPRGSAIEKFAETLRKNLSGTVQVSYSDGRNRPEKTRCVDLRHWVPIHERAKRIKNAQGARKMNWATALRKAGREINRETTGSNAYLGAIANYLNNS